MTPWGTIIDIIYRACWALSQMVPAGPLQDRMLVFMDRLPTLHIL